MSRDSGVAASSRCCTTVPAASCTGVTIQGCADGYMLHQHAYILDMLEKWGLDKASPVGTIDIEAYDEDETLPEPDIKEVRSAQRMSGGLIWLSGRTRPDLAFSVSRVSSQSTIRPLWALRLGKRILRYLCGTRHHVLMYKPFKSSTGLPLLEVYADASFEPTRARKAAWARTWLRCSSIGVPRSKRNRRARRARRN